MSNTTKFLSTLLAVALVFSQILDTDAGCSSNCMRILGAGIGKRKMNLDENRLRDENTLRDLSPLEDNWDALTMPLSRQFQDTINQEDVRRMSPQLRNQIYEILMSLHNRRK